MVQRISWVSQVAQRLMYKRYAVGLCMRFLPLANNFIKTGRSKVRCWYWSLALKLFLVSLDYTDRSNCILWGDGAGAVILQAADSASDKPQGIISTHYTCGWSSTKKCCMCLETKDGAETVVAMEGNPVFKVAVNTLDQIVDETLHRERLTMQKSDIDWLSAASSQYSYFASHS